MTVKTITFTRDSTLRSKIDKWIARELHSISAIIDVSSTTIVGKMVITYKG
jgi:hypothetical protein